MEIGHFITIGTFLFIGGGTIAFLKYQVKTLKEELEKREHEDDLLWIAINDLRKCNSHLKERIGVIEGKTGIH